MSKVCAICGKRPRAGSSIARRGRAKKKGGVGMRITGVSKRAFHPNLQKVRALVDGKVKTIRVCAKCLRSGKVIKPPHSPKPGSTPASSRVEQRGGDTKAASRSREAASKPDS